MSSTLIATSEFCLNASILPPLQSVAPSPTDAATRLIPTTILGKLKTIGLPRVRDMRSTNTTFQILSHVTADISPKACQKANDWLNSSIVTTPDRFAALALLPASDPIEAALELQRCVTRYKFVGGILGFGREGLSEKGKDDSEWEQLWKMATKYDVPICLTPMFLSMDSITQYEGRLPSLTLGPLITHFYQYESTSPLLLLSLYFSGVFDRNPNLKLVLSQHGHSIPMLLPRIDSVLSDLPHNTKPKRSFIDVWQHNIYVTTADLLDVSSIRALLDHMPVDRVLYGSNYPFEVKGRLPMQELRDSGVVAQEEWERIAFRNAEELFGLKGNAERPGRRSTSLT